MWAVTLAYWRLSVSGTTPLVEELRNLDLVYTTSLLPPHVADFALCPMATILSNDEDYILNLMSQRQITEPKNGPGDFLT